MRVVPWALGGGVEGSNINVRFLASIVLSSVCFSFFVRVVVERRLCIQDV